jgi:hypothetical protein
MPKILIKIPPKLTQRKKVSIEEEDHAYIEKITGAHVPSLSSCWIPLSPEVVEAEEQQNQNEQQNYEKAYRYYENITAIHGPFSYVHRRRTGNFRFKTGG